LPQLYPPRGKKKEGNDLRMAVYASAGKKEKGALEIVTIKYKLQNLL